MYCFFSISATEDKVNMALSDVVKIARVEKKKNKANKKPKEGGKDKKKEGKSTPGDKATKKIKAEGKANRDAKKDQKRGLNKDGKPQKVGKNNGVAKIAQNALKNKGGNTPNKGGNTPTLKITINTSTLEASTDKKLLSQVKAALSKEGKGPKGPNIVKPGIRKIVLK